MRRVALLVLVAAVGIGCSSSGSSQTSPVITPTATETKSATITPSATAPATLLCAPSNTRIHYSGGQGAAGTEFSEFVVTNVSSRPCHTGGYPGFALLDAKGQVMPTHVHRDPQPASEAAHGGPEFFLVPPGADFYVAFTWPEAACDGKGTQASAIRVTLPDNRAYADVTFTNGTTVAPCYGDLNTFRVYRRHLTS